MSWTIGRKLASLTGIGVAAALGVGLTGLYGLAEIQDDVGSLVAMSTAIRTHLNADMMHEGIKADVLGAMLSRDAGSIERSSADLSEHAETIRSAVRTNLENPPTPEIAAALRAAQPLVESYIDHAERAVTAASENPFGAAAAMPAFLDAFEKLETKLGNLSHLYASAVTAAQREAAQSEHSAAVASALLLLFAIVIGTLAGIGIARSIQRPLRLAAEAAKQLAEGDLATAVEADSQDEVGRMAQALNLAGAGLRDALGSANVDWAELGAQQSQVARLEAAVSGAGSCMMLIDRDFMVTYSNRSSLNLLRKHERTLRSHFPAFSANEIVGTCIDIFHKNPSHQRTLLANPANLPYQADIEVGPLRFHLMVNAIVDPDGEYIGNTLEWQDVTQEFDARQQIEGLIADATQGQLGRRIDASGYDGFTQSIAEGMNQTLDVVVRPIQDAMAAMRAVENGDLGAAMRGEYAGDFANLRDAINNTVKHLQELVGQIRGATTAISDSAHKLNEGNAELHNRTQQQAASLEECASTMEELSGSVRQNAASSRQAASLAGEAQDLAETGGSVVGEAVSAMGEINEASAKIAQIISVIDEIASQTNLLALNAAVEAARAGEQGRGFAVVAEEVSSLAQRSATAAKEIKELIDDSLKRVNQGNRLVNQSGETLAEIVNAVRKSAGLVTEIADAGEEQARGIEEVSKALTQMDTMTQQNALMVEEAVGQSENMEGHASRLNQLMSFFKRCA